MRSTCVNYQAKIQMKDARRRTTTQTRACTVLPCTRRVMISVRISPDGISTMRRHRQAVSKPMRRYLDCPRAFCSHIPCALQPHTWLADELPRRGASRTVAEPITSLGSLVVCSLVVSKNASAACVRTPSAAQGTQALTHTYLHALSPLRKKPASAS